MIITIGEIRSLCLYKLLAVPIAQFLFLADLHSEVHFSNPHLDALVPSESRLPTHLTLHVLVIRIIRIYFPWPAIEQRFRCIAGASCLLGICLLWY